MVGGSSKYTWLTLFGQEPIALENCDKKVNAISVAMQRTGSEPLHHYIGRYNANEHICYYPGCKDPIVTRLSKWTN